MIVAVEGVSVGSVTAMVAELNRHQPGDSVELTVFRNGENLVLTMTLGSWPDHPEVNIAQPFFHQESPDLPILSDLPPDLPGEFRSPQYHH